jgi:1-deoxy-D-xylulose-5-phosphate reductoisomerase
MSVPDMRSCVQYAVDYPERCEAVTEELDFFKVASLSFARPDTDSFPLLALAKRAIADGGAMPAVLNAADEIAVEAFLFGKIGFTDIFTVVEKTYEKMADAKSAVTIEAIIECDRRARGIASTLI